MLQVKQEHVGRRVKTLGQHQVGVNFQSQCTTSTMNFHMVCLTCIPQNDDRLKPLMDAIASQITSLTIVYSIVYSDADQRKHQSSASLAFVWGIHWGPVQSPHKWPVTRKMFPFDDVIMSYPVSLVNQNVILTDEKSHRRLHMAWNMSLMST